MAQALVAPLVVQATSWDVLQSKLRMHYASKPSKIATWHTFHHRNRAEGESINAYVAALHKAAIHCQFWDQDKMLLDRLVCGVRDVKLTKSVPALQMAVKEAQAAESADQATLKMCKPSSLPTPRQPIVVHREVLSDSKALTSSDDVCCLKSSCIKHKDMRKS